MSEKSNAGCGGDSGGCGDYQGRDGVAAGGIALDGWAGDC